MKTSEIINLIQTAKEIKIDSVYCSDEIIFNKINFICEFIKNTEKNYSELIEKFDKINVRFCDYYDPNDFHKEEIINYFKTTYKGPDLDDLCEMFSLYVIVKNSADLIYNFAMCETLDELYELLDNDYYFEDIMYSIESLEEKRISKQENFGLDFLNPNNKYKILFSGFSFKDITSLEKNVKKSLISKLSGQLSQSDIITLAESVDHVKDKYDFPLFRVQFCDDYRVAYIRKNNVTVILGVTLKTGKDKDYTRYDSVARKSNQIYEEVELFMSGVLPTDSQHYKVINHLEEFSKKIRQSK